MPPRPYRVPDPQSCADFTEWLLALTDKKRGGVAQTIVAAAAGTTPQAVTKWTKGGSIEVERLSRLASWTGASFQQLRNLIDESKLKTLPAEIFESAPTTPLVKVESEISTLFRALTPAHRKKVLGFAQALYATQKKPRK